MKPTHPGRTLFLALALCAPVLAAAQAYPAKPVRFVTASVGSPQDVVGRIFAQKIGETWGQPIVVDNRAGAGSLISIQTAAKASADGYTVLISSTAYAVTPFLYKELGYDVKKDLVPVALLATTPNILITSPSSGIRTLKDAVERARQGRDLHYGSPGFGTTPQLSADYLFKVLAKVNATHVPYKGIPGTIQATLGNEVDLSSTALPPAAPLVKAGRLVGLAVTSSKRSAALPDVPTVGEAGFADFEDDSWVGVWVPTGTPAPVIARLREELASAARSEDVRSKLGNVGFETGTLNAAGFDALVQKELRKWEKIVKETGTKVE
jgi:tripartite-type tricarboxylate transporter receptor subunit TctC